jgi:hypothetical protein
VRVVGRQVLDPIPGHVTCTVGIGQTVDVSLSEVPDVLGRSLPVILETPSAQRQGLHESRRITYSHGGHLLLSVYADPSRLVEATEAVCALMQEAAGEHCEWAALMENGGGLSLKYVYKGTGRGRLPEAWGDRRENDTEYVIDAFPWQMIGPKQLSKANDFSRWTLTPVSDLTVVRQPDLTGWLTSDHAERPQIAIHQDELARARRDFGPMIIPPAQRRQAP